MSFEGNEIQLKKYICDPQLIVSYNETILDEEGEGWIELLTMTKAPEISILQEMVPVEYHK
jgi:hypothetical protein